MTAINTHALSECDYDLDHRGECEPPLATRPASDALIGEPELNKRGAEKGESCAYEVISFFNVTWFKRYHIVPIFYIPFFLPLQSSR